MSIGRTIRIYLDDGSISGIRHAEIVNWTGQAVSAPRTQVKSLFEWEESKKPGVYFLFGVDESSGNSAVYIGEAENVLDRLQSHIVNKDFWNEVVFFTSKDENLTKSHVKYLESRLVQFAKLANRYSVLNSNEPQQPLLPRGDRDAMEEFLANIRVLLGVIGHKALESLAKHEIPKPLDNQIDVVGDHTSVESNFCLNVKNITAKALLTDEGIVVLSGSMVARDVRDSLSTGYKKLRSQLIESGVISKGPDGVFVFTRDQLFTSPSQAAAIIVGYAINGRNSWQTESGKTLKVVEEQVVTSI